MNSEDTRESNDSWRTL